MLNFDINTKAWSLPINTEGDEELENNIIWRLRLQNVEHNLNKSQCEIFTYLLIKMMLVVWEVVTEMHLL